jgi:hypothetical protein
MFFSFLSSLGGRPLGGRPLGGVALGGGSLGGSSLKLDKKTLFRMSKNIVANVRLEDLSLKKWNLEKFIMYTTTPMVLRTYLMTRKTMNPFFQKSLNTRLASPIITHTV